MLLVSYMAEIVSDMQAGGKKRATWAGSKLGLFVLALHRAYLHQ